MNTENRDLRQIAYQESGNFIRQYESMLFQRLNYYLVAIAFLVAGFVELVASSTQYSANPLLTRLAVLVGTTGFLISWFFTAINYFNGKTLNEAYEFAEKAEDDFLNNLFDLSQTKHVYRYINKDILASGKFKFGLKMLLYDSIIGSFQPEYNTKEGEPRAPHTWIIPFCFIWFWLIALSIYCGFKFHWWAFFVGSPVVGFALYHYKIYQNVYRLFKHR
jgi:hypothetical protein